MQELLPVIVMGTFVTFFGVALLALAAVLGPRTKNSLAKRMAYECGIEGTEAKSTRVPVKYYLTAILFILFDIEIIFMYPWALAFSDFIEAGHTLYIMGAMGVFLFIFIFGLFWEIKSKALEWE